MQKPNAHLNGHHMCPIKQTIRHIIPFICSEPGLFAPATGANAPPVIMAAAPIGIPIERDKSPRNSAIQSKG